jgi:hypothetical protein
LIEYAAQDIAAIDYLDNIRTPYPIEKRSERRLAFLDGEDVEDGRWVHTWLHPDEPAPLYARRKVTATWPSLTRWAFWDKVNNERPDLRLQLVKFSGRTLVLFFPAHKRVTKEVTDLRMIAAHTSVSATLELLQTLDNTFNSKPTNEMKRLNDQLNDLNAQSKELASEISAFRPMFTELIDTINAIQAKYEEMKTAYERKDATLKEMKSAYEVEGANLVEANEKLTNARRKYSYRLDQQSIVKKTIKEIKEAVAMKVDQDELKVKNNKRYYYYDNLAQYSKLYANNAAIVDLSKNMAQENMNDLD